MRTYVGITDYDWFNFLSHRSDLDEVNFWKPGGKSGFKALEPGGLFLSKLHARRARPISSGTPRTCFEAKPREPREAWCRKTSAGLSGIGRDEIAFNSRTRRAPKRNTSSAQLLSVCIY